MTDLPLPAATETPPRRATLAFMARDPAHWIALGFGSGLSPVAPGTVGTLWAWLVFAVLQPHLSGQHLAIVLAAGLPLGWWACTRTARHLNVADPSNIVWDEILAFWLVLWLVTPAGWIEQAIAFGLFRFFDAAKPGPVAWADGFFKGRRGQRPGWAQGFGILFDDLVAALCTLLVMALWRWWA
jgi:phosphatidylglycerophosphatase A